RFRPAFTTALQRAEPVANGTEKRRDGQRPEQQRAQRPTGLAVAHLVARLCPVPDAERAARVFWSRRLHERRAAYGERRQDILRLRAEPSAARPLVSEALAALKHRARLPRAAAGW
ncbi:hypothetical protein LTR38_018279, partial [Friedmanniomyces endolithicus]